MGISREQLQFSLHKKQVFKTVLDYSVTDSMNMSISKLQEMVKGRESWWAAAPGVTKSQTRLSVWTTITRLQMKIRLLYFLGVKWAATFKRLMGKYFVWLTIVKWLCLFRWHFGLWGSTEIEISFSVLDIVKAVIFKLNYKSGKQFMQIIDLACLISNKRAFGWK